MRRGRAKAKQTKVARELKYREFNTDFTELQRQLHGDSPTSPPDAVEAADTADEADDPFVDSYDGEASPASWR